ncbi:DUF4240 domain-containing protein [Amycolatopsis sp. K13G38]|uniref:DUF4240 domain-containing protein n=1 Tax=Amycolatopsis acididurans TaxID=2724524 RepID=A0ABX1JGP3_9PSEU|nr:DUF4240 domain-containing protein [Amycolatopsis acididurans]NKQ58778.1 DUF4240 domain-containing protein [Amycolatopsis acididurans]
MNERRFWRLVRRAHTAERDETAPIIALLLGLLHQEAAPDVIRFHRRLAEVHRRAYRWDLWTAFRIVLGEVDAALFSDAVSWLILRGKRTFRRTLVDPDFLASLPVERVDLAAAGRLLGLAHERLTPSHDPDADLLLIQQAISEALRVPRSSPVPPGELPSMDGESLRARYPRLCGRYPLDGIAAPVQVAPGRRRDVVSDA